MAGTGGGGGMSAGGMGGIGVPGMASRVPQIPEKLVTPDRWEPKYGGLRGWCDVTSVDDDCSGTVNDHCGIWAIRAGTALEQRASSVVADVADNILMTEQMYGSANFGGVPVEPNIWWRD